MTRTFIRFVNIILAGLLAGTSFGIWLGFNPKGYSPLTYIEVQQNLVSSLNAVMVTLVVLATAVTLMSAFLNRKRKSDFIILLLAAASFASCIIISRIGNYPIQTEMLSWSTDQLPGNWTTLRDEWWFYHSMRTIAELLALALVAWTLVKKEKP